MSEAHLPRPGAVLGLYPEREDERLSTLDRTMAIASGWLRQKLAPAQFSAPVFLGMARREGRKLDDMSEIELMRHRDQLRLSLRSAGHLTPRLIAQAFALIRKTAETKLKMRPYDVQLLGGLVMMRGRIAEMDTGEGKTLTATLPAATAALAGSPVHVITVNDFLAERDARWMGPIYRALGLSVGVILEGMEPDERRAAYACDVVYGTNKQIAFDYLKDRIALGDETRTLHIRVQGLTKSEPPSGNLLLRGLCFAIVDEADSCLVDEARTPLIISRAGDMSGMEHTYQNAIDLAGKLATPRDFTVLQRDRRVLFTDIGKSQIRKLSETWGGVWAAEVHREELIRQAITALRLYERDKHYIVREGRIAIVDEYTGRVMADRSWERGLHQMIEVKEGLEVTGSHETLARISYQRFFGRYLHLCGMTGTAREVSGELWSVYSLMSRRVASNKRSRRRDHGTTVYATDVTKNNAVLKLTQKMHAKGRPVLIGTRSVAASETISDLLTRHGLDHSLLNARQDKQESDVIGRAGLHGAITVATNMAGRGTDISIDPDVDAKGGLFVIATEPHDARRIDRQLYGRCARQGNKGGHVMLASLEDELVVQAFGPRLAKIARALSVWKGRVPRLIFRPLVRSAQLSAERRNSSLRRALLRHDDSTEDLLAFSGRTE
jgi:preprotein translocase subunit SecA